MNIKILLKIFSLCFLPLSLAAMEKSAPKKISQYGPSITRLQSQTATLLQEEKELKAESSPQSNQQLPPTPVQRDREIRYQQKYRECLFFLSDDLGSKKELNAEVQLMLNAMPNLITSDLMCNAAKNFSWNNLHTLLEHIKRENKEKLVALCNETSSDVIGKVFGNTPMQNAAWSSKWKNVLLLLAYGAVPNKEGKYNQIALHYATTAREKTPYTAALLCAFGENVNARNTEDYRTAGEDLRKKMSNYNPTDKEYAILVKIMKILNNNASFKPLSDEIRTLINNPFHVYDKNFFHTIKKKIESREGSIKLGTFCPSNPSLQF